MSRVVRTCLWASLVLFLATGLAYGQNSEGGAVDVREFDSEVDRQRYQSFIAEMRCPKCQNENLAGSSSPIARDLRNQLYELIEAGRSDKEIVDFMVERYGEYILYRPRLSPATLLLWLGPVVLILGGIIFLIVLVMRKRRTGEGLEEDAPDLRAAERAHLEELLRREHPSDDESNNP